MSERDEIRIHWGWVSLSALAGLTLIALGHVGDLWWKWPAVTTSTLTSIGAAFLLAFVLFLMERRFTRSIARQVGQVTDRIVASNSQALDRRLSDLEDRLNARNRATEREQNAAVAAIADDLSFETVRDALDSATMAGAIREGGLTVSASIIDPRLLATISYTTRFMRRGNGQVIDDGATPRLYVELVVKKLPADIGRPVIETIWSPGEGAEAVGIALRSQLQRAGRRSEAKAFDLAHTIREFQRGLQLGFADTQAALGTESLDGAILELIGPDWVITSRGIQNLRNGYRKSFDELALGPNQLGGRAITPQAPEGIENDTWRFVFERAVEQKPTLPLRI